MGPLVWVEGKEISELERAIQGGVSMEKQINIFGETVKEEPCENCYCCRHFAEFKEPRTFAERGGEFTVFGMCDKRVGKNGSYTFYPVYVPRGKCKDFKKARGRK